MNVTVTGADLNKISNILKMFRRAKFEELDGEEIMAISGAFVWLYNVEQSVKKVPEVASESVNKNKPKVVKKAKKNVRTKPVAR